jgi:hypothetical protein
LTFAVIPSLLLPSNLPISGNVNMRTSYLLTFLAASSSVVYAQDLGSIVNDITSAMGSVATSLATVVTSGGGGVLSTVTSGAESVATSVA